MSTAAVILIVAGLLVLLVVGMMVARAQSRRRRLRERFGPEYDRLAESANRREAERELARRERRYEEELDIRPLDDATRQRYTVAWAQVQERFVDQPERAASEAGQLVTSLMSERGYPTEDHRQQIADLSVQHARVLDNYRAAREITMRADGTASTEDLRQAMVHYRALFADLLDEGVPAGRHERDERR